MKKVLLGTTALLGVGLMAGTASAADGIKLSLGGWFRTGFGFTIDDNSQDNGAAELGHDRNVTGVYNNSEIHFNGETTLDNGLTVGVRVELEGESSGDQIDASYAYMSGGFGEVRLGSHSGVSSTFAMYPPGSSTSFGVFSPFTAGAVTTTFFVEAASWLPGRDKAQKITYFSPVWSGFSFGLSYTPNSSAETQVDGVAFSFHRPRGQGESNHDVEAGLHYNYAGDGWGLDAGAAAYFEGDVEGTEGDNKADQFYNAGLNLSFGGFSVGASGSILDGGNTDSDMWGVGVGAAYNVDAWTVGVSWAHRAVEDNDPTTGRDDFILDRAGVTGNYAMGPGVNLEAEIMYTWVSGAASSTEEAGGTRVHGYDAFEMATGMALSF
jgi:outer membrane protein OmpU